VAVEPSRLGTDPLELGFLEMTKPREPTRVVAPRYPVAAVDTYGGQRCIAELRLDTSGKPTEVYVSGCSAVFHPVVRDALLQWQYAPYSVDGTPTPATVKVPIRFRPS
jgi:hypothetical protein